MSQQTFFDNNEGLISPDGHRKYNEAVIDTMAMDEDVQQLINPEMPMHAHPTVVDEVMKNQNTSWNRSQNHIAHVPLWGNVSFVRFPIGEKISHYSYDNGKVQEARRTFGPAIQVSATECYFMVFEAGRYLLMQKQYQNLMTNEIFDVTQEQAASGYRINFDDGVTSSTTLIGSGKSLRTFARLYFVTHDLYQNVNYSVPSGTTFKYSTDLTQPNPIAGGEDVGVAVYAVKPHGLLLTRQGINVSTWSVVRSLLHLRPTFAINTNVGIGIKLFIYPDVNNNGGEYEVWHKKSKTWYYSYNKKRYTHRIVGYVKTGKRKIEDIMVKGLKSSEGKPQYIDFQIRMKNAEKAVVAQYRATYQVNLDDSGKQQKYILFRRR